MSQYQEKFFQRYIAVLHDWKESSVVENEDLHQFLTSVQGTASIIGMEDLSKTTSELLRKIDKDASNLWSTDEWQEFLQPVTTILNAHHQSLSANVTKAEQTREQRQAVILIIANDSDANSLREHLETISSTVFTATTIDRAIYLFYDYYPDIVVIDYHIDESHGKSFMREISSIVKNTFLPVIYIGSAEPATALKDVFDEGANDYFRRPFNKEDIVHLITNRLELKELFKKRTMADHTEHQEIRLHQSDSTIVNLLEKVINDTTTPTTVSLAFVSFTEKSSSTVNNSVLYAYLKEAKRAEDDLFPYNNGTYVVTLPDTNPKQAKMIVEQWIDTFQQTNSLTDQKVSTRVMELKDYEETADKTIEEPSRSVEVVDTNIMPLRRQRRQRQTRVESTVAPIENILRISIVEDETVIRRMLFDHFSRFSFNNFDVEVKAFRQGEEFLLSSWYKFPCKHIIILDSIMPRMNGLEVMNKLRAMENEKDMGIVLLSALQTDKDVITVFELGADDFITKPFSIKQLEARVKRLLIRMK